MSDDDLLRRYREMFGEDLFRPRDGWDVGVPPESLRGKALALMDATAEAHAALAALAKRHGTPQHNP